METYHKIQTLFKRHLDGPNKGKMIEGEWTTPELEYLAKNQWEFTEKVDGTNIRIGWNPYTGEVEFGGRTDNAVVPKPLLEYLYETFDANLFFSAGLLGRFLLFGEGYGPKIQGGGNYRPDHSFVLFDIVSKSGTIEEWNTNHSDQQNVTRSGAMSHGECVSPVTERNSERSQSSVRSGTNGQNNIETVMSRESTTPGKVESGIFKRSLESLSKTTRNCLNCKVEFVPFVINQKLPEVEMETLRHSQLTIAMIRYVLEAYCAEHVMSAYSKLTGTPDGSKQPQPTSHDFWLNRDDVDDVAAKLGIDSVPTIGYGTLHDAIDIVSSGITFEKSGAVKRWGSGTLQSAWGNFAAEGIVARPKTPMFDRKGQRIITKIKAVDFK